MNAMKYRQYGFGFTGWFIVIALFAFFMLMGVTLFPLYNEKWAVTAAMNSVANREGAENFSTKKVREYVLKSVGVSLNKSVVNSNTIKDVVHVEKDSKSKKKYLRVTYQASNQFIKDLHLTLMFDHKVPLGGGADGE